MEIDIHFVREKVIIKELDVRYVLSFEPKNLMTKPLTTTRFEPFYGKLILAKT